MGVHRPSSEDLSPFLEGYVVFGGIYYYARNLPRHTTVQHITCQCSLGVFAAISVLGHSPKPRWGGGGGGGGVSSDWGGCVTSSGDFGEGQLVGQLVADTTVLLNGDSFKL